MNQKLYPIGVQNFEKLRKGGFFYIDKTALLYQLVQTGCYYFLSRPRRFGKSLLLSTLEAYFEGKRELFEGLAIDKLEKNWVKHPILHLDLNTEKYETVESLERKLNHALTAWEEIYGSRPTEQSLGVRFEGIIQRAHELTGQSVVILVDEYDKPMLQAIGNEALQHEFQNTLKGFYGALKSQDGHIRFAMLTGVTKYGKISVFSDLNNLDDISMWDRYEELCGISEQELIENLQDEISAFAHKQGLTPEALLNQLRERYDGYHFAPHTVGMYNPFSLLLAFNRQQFGNYWFETGTPTYLVELLKRHHYDLHNLTEVETDADVLNSIDASSTSPLPVIYQSGYLTIKGYDERFGIYRLGFPNREVEEGFMRFLMPYYTKLDHTESAFEIKKFVQEVEQGKIDAFMRRLQSFYADIPYELTRNLELHYQNVLFIISKLVGFYVQVEYHTSAGRIDMVLQTHQFIYIIEFKLNGSAEEALQQIEDRHYALPFASNTHKLFKVGVNFDKNARNIERWLVQEDNH